MQPDDGRFVVRGPKGREHIIEATGEHVTSVRRLDAAHQARLRGGTIRPATDEELERLKAFVSRGRPMQDEEITLYNGCTDLVGLRKNEAFQRHLLEGKRPGEWVRVREFCSQAGVAGGDLKPELFAAWLPDPLADEAYAVILFYDDESKWSMAAHYNRRRLWGGAPPQPIQAAGSVSSGSAPPQTTPAAERKS